MNFNSFRTQIIGDFNTTIQNLGNEQIYKLVVSIIPLQFSRFLSTDSIKKYFLLLTLEEKKQYLYKVFVDPSSLSSIASINNNDELNSFIETNMTRRHYQILSKLILINNDLLNLQHFLSVIPVIDMKHIILSKPNEFKTIILQLSIQQLLPILPENYEQFFDFNGIL